VQLSKFHVGYALVVLAVLTWAGNAVVGRAASSVDIPPIALNFWRWAAAGLILAPFAIAPLRAQWDAFRAHWRLWVAFGLVTVVGFNTTFYVALKHTTVVQGTLISALMPIVVLVAARFLFTQPITARQLAGVVVSILGVGVIVSRGDAAVLQRLVFNVGDLWMLAATCLWAAQTVFIRFVPKGMNVVAFQTIAIAVGVVALAPLYGFETASGHPMPATWHAVLFVAYTAILASVVGFTCWNLGVARIGPKTAGYFGNLFPIFSAALGILLLGEPLHPFHLAGGILILGGIYLATVSSAAAQPKAAAGIG
jgi:drug/metabolite transporter (DMT)-like permease